jgi:hypothetical protein
VRYSRVEVSRWFHMSFQISGLPRQPVRVTHDHMPQPAPGSPPATHFTRMAPIPLPRRTIVIHEHTPESDPERGGSCRAGHAPLLSMNRGL